MAADYGPLVELLFSGTAHHGPRGDLLFGRWWQHLTDDTRRRSRTIAMFGGCAPPIDLITITGQTWTIEQNIELLPAASRELLQPNWTNQAR